MGVFNNLSATHSYMSLTTANISLLAKIADDKIFLTVLKALIQPMVQLNVPQKNLKLTEDPKPNTSVADCLEKLRKVLPKNRH